MLPPNAQSNPLKPNADYRPGNCDLSDELEALSVKHKGVTLSYSSEDGISYVTGHIQDIYAKDHADWVKLVDGTEIRLDRIIEWREGT